MATQTPRDKIEILNDAFRSGKLDSDGFRAAVKELYLQMGFDDAAASEQMEEWYSYARTGQSPYLPSQTPYDPVPQVQGPLMKEPTKYDSAGNLVKTQGALPEEVNPFGAYQRGISVAGGNAGIGGGEFGNYLQGRYNPTNAVFLGQRAVRGLNPAGQQEDPNAFANYATKTRGGGLGEEAQLAFQGLMNKLTGDVSKLGAADPSRPFLTPDSIEDYGLGASLGQEAARGRMGGYAASRLLPSNSALINQFRAGPTGAQSTAWMDFVRKAYGL